MIKTKYEIPLPNNEGEYRLTKQELIEYFEKAYSNGFEDARDLYDPERQATTTYASTYDWITEWRE